MIKPFLSRFAHDGSNDYRTFGDPASIRFQIGDAWTMVTEYAAQGVAGKTIYSKQDTAFGILIRHSTAVPGAIEVILAGSTGLIGVHTTGTGFANGAARKLSVSYSGNSLASGILVVIDGVSEALTVDTDAYGGTLDANYPAAIGALHNAAVYSERYAGTLADLFFLAGAATAAKMIAFHNAAQGTRPSSIIGLKELFWAAPGAMVGTSEPDLIDGANGTLVGLTGADLEPNDVYNRRSCTFDAVNEHISYGDNLDLNAGSGTDSCTLASWFKIDGDPAAVATIMGKQSVAGFAPGYSVSVHPTGVIIGNLAANAAAESTQAAGVGSVTGNVWIHIILVIDGTANTLTLYANGVVNGGGASYSFTATTGNTEEFTVGDKQDATVNPYDGWLSQCLRFGKAISAGEATELFNLGKVGDPESLSFATDLDFHTNFELFDDATAVADRSSSALSGTPVNMDATNFVTDVP